ncbi:MAG TPA: ribonuclease HII [Pseudomonadales bacterium]
MLFEDLGPPAMVAGVDEVGRGPLAGPVLAAAVILRGAGPEGLRDSKKLSAKRRLELAAEIRATAVAWSIGRAEVQEIDALNVLRATHLAMQRAVLVLDERPQVVLVDGNLLPSLPLPAVAIVKGDDRIAAISAASIIAKVARDQEMTDLANVYPGYGFERHKGYGTAEHLAALDALGPSPAHRMSFAPCRKAASARRTGPSAVAPPVRRESLRW